MTVTDTAGAAFFPDSRIDPGLWPDVAVAPHSPIRAAVARRLFRHAAARLPLRVEEAGRAPYGGGGHRIADDAPGPSPGVLPPRRRDRHDRLRRVLHGRRLVRRRPGRRAVRVRRPDARPDPRRPCSGCGTRCCGASPTADDNTITGARTNISRHYDLSNDLFQLFLDETLTYSSALFLGDPGDSADQDLAGAQRRKIDRLLDVAEVRDGSRLLEIGTGWGELAIRAAKRGAIVTSITLSEEQAALARERIAAEGLADRATVELCDYRQTQGKYDAVVSRRDDRGGRVQALARLLRHRRPAAGARRPVRAAGDHQQDDARCRPAARPTPGPASTSSPAASCRRSRASRGRSASTPRCGSPTGTCSAGTTPRRCGGGASASRRSAAEVGALGFDATFRRMWSLYLAYSEAGFRTGYLDVGQFTLTKPA